MSKIEPQTRVIEVYYKFYPKYSQEITLTTASYAIKLKIMYSVFAQNGVSIEENFAPAKNFPTLGSLISVFLPNALLVAGIIVFIMVVLGGFAVITGAGSGDPHNQEKAKSFLTYALIGLMIIFGAYWILQIINFITGGTLKGIV